MWLFSAICPTGVSEARSPPCRADAAAARAVDFAAEDAVVLSPCDLDGHVPQISHHTFRDLRIPAVIHHDRSPAGGLEDHPLKRDVLDPAESHEPVRHRDDRTFLIDRRRGPEVENAALAIQIPLARRVEFRQDIQPVEPLADAVAVVVIRRRHGDDSLLRVDRLDLLPLIGPVPEPVAMNPGVVLLEPAARPVPFVHELAGLAALGAPDVDRVGFDQANDVDEPLIGPAGQGHGLVVEEQFQTAAFHLPIVVDARGLQIRPEDLVPGLRGQSLQHGLVGDRLPAADQPASDNPHLLARTRPIRHGLAWTPGILSG